MEVFQMMNAVIGLNTAQEDLGIGAMVARAVIVFIIAILMVRIGHKRFMGRNTSVDVLLGFMIGSILSRAITGNSPFFPTIAAGFALVCLHWLFTAIAFYWQPFSRFSTGRERCLIKDGEYQKDQMRKAHILEYDLLEAMRASGQKGDIDSIHSAYLERNGGINVILKNPQNHHKRDEDYI